MPQTIDNKQLEILARRAVNFLDKGTDLRADHLSLRDQFALAALATPVMAEVQHFIEMETAFKDLAKRQPPVDETILNEQAVQLCQEAIRVSEQFAMVAKKITGEKGFAGIIPPEQHDQAISDSFLFLGKPLLAKAYAPAPASA
jgi:hypothetical protein